MKKAIQLTAAVFMTIAAAAAALPEARLAEIEASLPETPRADGAPAADRSKWEPLAATKEGRSAIVAAEKLLPEPVPLLPTPSVLLFVQRNPGLLSSVHPSKPFLLLRLLRAYRHKPGQ